MKYVAVIPSIYQPYTDACVASCKLDNVHVVDNTHVNSGVAASWNVGVREMYRADADWCVIVSAGVRFGDAGGRDLLDLMDANPGLLCVDGANLGWHLRAMNRRIFDEVGLFDENIWPAYCEDTDWTHRCNLAFDFDWHFDPVYWIRPEIDATLEQTSHGVNLAKVETNGMGQREYYVRKWGGDTNGWGSGGNGKTEWPHPFNNPANDHRYWPDPVHGARIGQSPPEGGERCSWDWIDQFKGH